MALRSGINVSYDRDFVLDESALRGIKVVFEQAARGLPFPTEVVYHVHIKDAIYYETNRIEEILADPNTDAKKIDYLYVELRRADQLSRVDGNDQVGWIVSEWIVWLAFDVLRPNWWVPYHDKILLRIDSEDKVWVSSLSEEVDRLIQDISRPKQVSTGWFMAFILPAIVCGLAVYFRLSNPGSRSDQLAIFLAAMASLALAMAGFYLLGEGRPGALRTFIGPQSTFLWGEQEKRAQFLQDMYAKFTWILIVVLGIVTAMGILYWLW